MTRPKAPANQERILYDDLLRRLMGLLFLYQGIVRLTLLKNIALLPYALLPLFHGARGGNGWLSKAALARCLPLETGAKGREQRLYRFLANPRLTPEVLIPLHIALVLGIQSSVWVPPILDQTTIRGIQTLLIGAVFEGRVLPVAFSCFTYGLIRKSQNILEQGLIMAVMSCFPAESRPLLILDRGYARVALLQKLRQAGIPFFVRAKKKVVVYFQGQPRALSRFPYQPGQIQRYSVFYHCQAKEPLDLIIFSGLGLQGNLVSAGPQRVFPEGKRDRRSVRQTHVHRTRIPGLEDPLGGARVDLPGLRSRSPAHPPASGLLA